MPVNTQIYEQLRQVMLAGDEAAAKQFLVDHIAEFPEDLQGSIILSFFEEGLSQAASPAAASAVVAKAEGLKALRFLEQMKMKLKDKIAADDVKKGL